jgi:hypothetical protein
MSMGFAIKVYLGDVFYGFFNGCLDPAVPMETHIMTSSSPLARATFLLALCLAHSFVLLPAPLLHPWHQ